MLNEGKVLKLCVTYCLGHNPSTFIALDKATIVYTYAHKSRVFK
jgi:hypothetical protein